MQEVKPQEKIVFVGAGKLATNLSVALQKAGYTITQVYSRTEEAAKALGERIGCAWTNHLENIAKEADIYIYALTDSVLPHIASQPIGNEEAIHLHTAGSMNKDVFSTKKRYGVLYPFQSFSKEQLVDFSHVPILTEGSDETVENTITKMAQRISERVYQADLEHRQRLHLAGVFANNFTNCMYAIAEEQLQKAGLPFDILLPLIKETAHRVETIAPRKAQTGPARRHDTNVMEKHIQLLQDDTSLETLYRIISTNIMNHEA